MRKREPVSGVWTNDKEKREMMNKSFVHRVSVIAACAFLTLCGVVPVGASSGGPVEDVSLISKYEDIKEYAVIIATDDDGLPVWTLKTDEYDGAQLSAFADIGIWHDQYLYVERGKVVALDLNTGAKKWENSDFGGSPSQYCRIIKENGNVYLSGSLGPDFYAIDCNGNTLGRVEKIDPDYYWPVSLNVTDDTVYIRMSGSPDGTETEVSRKLSDCLTAGAPAQNSSSGYTDDDLVWMAGEYYYMQNGERPPVVEIDSVSGDEVTIHLYENLSDNTATWDWYYINRSTLRGNDLLGREIDFNMLAS